MHFAYHLETQTYSRLACHSKDGFSQTLAAALAGSVIEPAVIFFCQYCLDKGDALSGKMPKSDPLTSLPSQVQ